MKKKDLKRHLNLYSIFKKRSTTINHAFASAISYYANYDELEIEKALLALNQNPDSDLKCVYCNEKADTWDHLESLVKKGMFTGYGHELGNLVPSCKRCNSSKGGKDFISFIGELSMSDDEKQRISTMLTRYQREFGNNVVDIESFEYKEVTKKYYDIKDKIFELMKEADIEAERIRAKLKNKSLL